MAVTVVKKKTNRYDF